MSNKEIVKLYAYDRGNYASAGEARNAGADYLIATAYRSNLSMLIRAAENAAKIIDDNAELEFFEVSI